MSSIGLLLQAAMYLDRMETDQLCDHGYASPNLSFHQRQQQSRRPKHRAASWSSSGSSAGGGGVRSIHNELEKNRRANLRHCLNRLRDTIPVQGQSAKNTTLQLLKRAKQHIMKLEEDNQCFEQLRKKLVDQRKQLNEHLKHDSSSSCSPYQLSSHAAAAAAAAAPFSGASFQFIQDSDTASSSPSVSDSDDVDIMGSASESDDYSR